MTSDQVARTRRRFARRQWSRRWLRWRAVVAAVLALLLGVALVWLVFFSTVLAVKGVDVQGNTLLADAEVRAAAAVPWDEPLARVDLDAIEGRVRALAPVRSVDVTRKWPDQILVTVVERQAVAVAEVGSGFKGLDLDGVLFLDFDRRPKELPLIVAADGVDREAMREGAGVVAALPEDLRGRVYHVEVRSVDLITLELRDGRLVEWGSADDSDEKAEVLDSLIAASPKARVYNVSVPGRPATRAE